MLAFSTAAWADVEPSATANQTTATESAPAQTPTWALSYWAVYSGPAISHPLSGGTINTSSLYYDSTSPQNLYNQFKLDYSLNDDIFVGPVVNFYFNPISGTGQQLFNMSDSGVRIGHRHIIHTDHANLMADLRIMAPLRPSYQANDELIDLQSLQVFTWDVPHTKWTLGVLGFHYYQQYGSGIPIKNPNLPGAARDLTMYVAPNATYQFAKTVGAVLFVEFYPYHVYNRSWLEFASDPMDIAPGISWDITPSLNITPELLMYPARFSFDTLSPLVYITWKII
jgi:hypothetical protein